MVWLSKSFGTKQNTPSRSRTRNLLIRSQTLYPIELWAHQIYRLAAILFICQKFLHPVSSCHEDININSEGRARVLFNLQGLGRLSYNILKKYGNLMDAISVN